MVESGPLRHLRVDGVESQAAVLDAVLELLGKVGEPLAVQIRSVVEAQLQLICQKALECAEALQTVHDDDLSVVVLGEVEDGKGNPHHDGLDQLALFGHVPEKVALEGPDSGCRFRG